MRDYEEKVDELSAKLVNGEIQPSDISDELLPDVVAGVMFDLPISTMEAVVARLGGIVAAKEQLLAQTKRKVAEVNWRIRQYNNTQHMEDDNICAEEQMKAEATSRLMQLVSVLGLNPNVVNYWNEGQLYYSYLTAGGFMGSIDKIEYDPKYVAVVKQFKEEYGSMVYHVIESSGALILLIVSKYVDDWEYERLEGNRIMAYVHNFDAPDQSEFGDVFLSSLHGALVRIG